MKHSGEFRTIQKTLEPKHCNTSLKSERNLKYGVLHSRKPIPAHDQTSKPRISASQTVPLSFRLRPDQGVVVSSVLIPL